MQKFRIVREYDDHEPVILGHVTYDSGDGAARIEQLWQEFCDSQPDCDTDFIAFLESCDFGTVEDDFVAVRVGGGPSPLLS